MQSLGPAWRNGQYLCAADGCGSLIFADKAEALLVLKRVASTESQRTRIYTDERGLQSGRICEDPYPHVSSEKQGASSLLTSQALGIRVELLLERLILGDQPVLMSNSPAEDGDL